VPDKALRGVNRGRLRTKGLGQGALDSCLDRLPAAVRRETRTEGCYFSIGMWSTAAMHASGGLHDSGARRMRLVEHFRTTGVYTLEERDGGIIR